jgi:hypothetical protein
LEGEGGGDGRRLRACDGTTIGLRSRIEHFGLAAVGAKRTCAETVMSAKCTRMQSFTSWLPAANDEPRSTVAVAAIVVAGASRSSRSLGRGSSWGRRNSAEHSVVPGSASSVHNTRCRPDRPGRRWRLRRSRSSSRRRGVGSGGRERRGIECARRDGLHGVLPWATLAYDS